MTWWPAGTWQRGQVSADGAEDHLTDAEIAHQAYQLKLKKAIRAAMTSEGVSRPNVEVWSGASDDEVYDSEVPLSPTSSWDSCALSDVDPHELTPDGVLDTESQSAPETRALSPPVSSPPGSKPVLHTETLVDVETKAVSSSVCKPSASLTPTTVLNTDSPKGVEDKAVSPPVCTPWERLTPTAVLTAVLDTGAANHAGAKAVSLPVCETSESATLTDAPKDVLVDQSEGFTREVSALETKGAGSVPLSALLLAGSSAPGNGNSAQIEGLASAVPESFAAEGSCADSVPLPALSLADLLPIETAGRVVNDVIAPMGYQKPPALAELTRGGTGLADVEPSEEEGAGGAKTGLSLNRSVNELGLEETGWGHVSDEEKGEAVETAGEKTTESHAVGSQSTGADVDLAVKKCLLGLMERFSSEQTFVSGQTFPSEARGSKEEACAAADIGATEAARRGADELADLAVKKARAFMERFSLEQTFPSEHVVRSQARRSKEEACGAPTEPTGWKSEEGEPRVGSGKTGIQPTGLEEATGERLEAGPFKESGETGHTGWGLAAAKVGEEAPLQITETGAHPTGPVEGPTGPVEGPTGGSKEEKSLQVAGERLEWKDWWEIAFEQTGFMETTGGSEFHRVPEQGGWGLDNPTETWITMPGNKMPKKDRVTERETQMKRSGSCSSDTDSMDFPLFSTNGTELDSAPGTVKAERSEEVTETGYPEPNRPVILSYKEILARLGAVNPTEWSPVEAEGVTETEETGYPEPNRPVFLSYKEKMARLRAFSLTGSGFEATGSESTVWRRSPEEESAEDPVDVIRSDVEPTERRLVKATRFVLKEEDFPPLERREESWSSKGSESEEAESDTDLDVPDLVDDSMAWLSEEEFEPVDAARRIDAQGHHIAFLSHQLRTCRKTISELEASCKEARTGRETSNKLLQKACARENALNQEVASLKYDLDATLVKCIYLDYCSDQPTHSWRTSDLLERSEYFDQAVRLIPVKERLSTERIFDPPIASEFSTKQLWWLLNHIDSLTRLPEPASPMRAHSASRMVTLPDWIPAHVAKSKVDTIFRDGLEVWDVPGFAEMRAEMGARAWAVGDVSCEEYVDMATGVAERLKDTYMDLGVGRLGRFPKGTTRQDAARSWGTFGDVQPCTEEPVEANYLNLASDWEWDGCRWWRDTGILSGPEDQEEIRGAPVEQSRDYTSHLVFDPAEDVYAPPPSQLCRSVPAPSRSNGSLLEGSWAMDLQSELTDAVQGFADLFMDGRSSPVWDEIGSVLPVAVKEIQEEFARTAEEFTPGKLARGVSGMVMDVFEDFCRKWGEDTRGW